jgi:RNA polymerase sigma-70 factor (ECF subfamily)
MRKRSDASLLAAAQSDARAFRELYGRYASNVYAYQLARSRNPDAAHDLTAETFAQAWISRGRFRDEADGSAAPWLYAIARHVLLGSVRKGALERSACERLGILDALDRAPESRPDESWLEGLDDALDALPASQRRAIELRIVDDLDYDAIASRLDTTPAAARVRVHRGLGTLRRHILNALEATR